MTEIEEKGEDEPVRDSSEFSANDIFGISSRIPFFDSLMNEIVRED
jgi:hypothetical protein